MYIKELQFSLWADFIERDFISTGLRNLILKGVVNGATSNPAIFKNAILSSPAYKAQLADLEGMGAKEKYETLAITDIQSAADELRGCFDAGDDGYVSIEVDPHLCDDAEGTLEEARRLYRAIDRPNVMIKVPATEAGYHAMEVLVSEGIAVNSTLIFSQEQAVQSAQAFARGLKVSDRDVDTVISIFVSRFDRALDAKLEAAGIETAKTGIYNAAAIYDAIETLGVPGCRALFASTGVKGGGLDPDYYVSELLAPRTVNTAPIGTVEAFVSGARREAKLPIDPQVIQAHFGRLSAAGIDFDATVAQLIDEGLSAFKEAFDDIMSELE